MRAGFAYIADREARVIRKLDLATGDETIFAGTGGKRCSAAGRPATLAQFAPEALDFDAEGNLYVADSECASVWRIDAATGIVARAAGNGQSCSGGGVCGDGGPATAARLGGGGIDIAVDAQKNIYIADAILDRVRRVAANGVITNFAGGGLTLGDGGLATSARLDDPRGLAVDGNVVFIADYRQHRIRRVTGGTITTIAGTGVKGTTGDGGPAGAAQIDQPWDVAVSAGVVYFSQGGVLGVSGQKRVRRIAGGTIDTVAGRNDGGFSGDGGPATEAELGSPAGIALESGSLFIADFGNRRVRQVRPDQTIDTIAGSGVFVGRGDGNAAVGAQLDRPRGIAYDAVGNLYIAETQHGRVRRVDAATGLITTFAGGGAPSGGIGDGLPATAAVLDLPVGVVVDPAGNFFIAERGGNRVRKVDTAGIITTYAGTGAGGSSGDGGPATAALLQGPLAIALDGEGNLYIAGRDDRVRKVDPGGQITTFAGGGPGPGHGDGGPAVAASLNRPEGLAVDRLGNLYIGEAGANRVRKVDPSGIITTHAGTGTGGFSGDGGPATSAQLLAPSGVVADTAGNLFIVDSSNQRIRSVDAAGAISTYAGNPPPGATGFSGDGGSAAAAEFSFTSDIFAGVVSQLAVAPDGRLTIADTGNDRVRQIMEPLPGFAAGERLVASGDGSDLFVFSSSGRHLRTLDAVTSDTTYTFGYDGAGRLTTIADLDGQVTKIQRLADGTPTAIVAAGGQQTTLTLGDDGFLSRVSDPGGHAVLLGYGEGGLLTSETDPNGNRHEFEYDLTGRLRKDADPAGGFLSLSREDSSDFKYEVTSKTAMSRTRRYSVEQLPGGGSERINTFPSGAQMTEAIRTDGSRRIAYPDGATVSFELVGDPRFGLQTPFVSSLITRLPSGLTQTNTGSTTVTLADPKNPLSLVTQTNVMSINGRTFTSVYDAPSRTSTSISAAGVKGVTKFDSKGRAIELRNAEGLEPANVSYDSSGRVSKLEQGIQSWTYAYDAFDRLRTVTDAAGASARYGYDDDTSRVTTVTTPSGKEYGFVFDANGNRTEVRMPSGAVHKQGYTKVNLQSSYQAPGSPAQATAFNLDRQITQLTLPTGRSVVRAYDPSGRPTDITTADAATHIDYADLTQRASLLTRTPTGGGTAQTLSFGYDGHLVIRNAFGGVAAGEYRYRYDNNFNVVGITFDSEQEVPLTRDADGRMTGFGPFTFTRGGPGNTPSRIGDGTLAQDFTYDAIGRLRSKTTKVAAATPYSVAYTHDNRGRLTKATEAGAGAHVYEYEYDLDGSLEEVKKDGVVAETYTYDVNGNRTSRKLGAEAPVVATYDGQDRIVSRGGVDYTYDADGYLTGRGGDTFTYSAQGELLSATVAGATVRYAYDGFGRMVARTDGAGTTQVLYGHLASLFQPTATRSPGGTLTHYFYDEDEKLFAFQRGSARFYVATDQVGSPRVVTNAAGVVQKVLEYDAFGAVLSDSNPSFDLPIGYAGGIADPATGLVRFGLRDYEPLAGRWTARDPILFSGAQANLYVYVGNDPISRRDPTGMFCVSASGFYVWGVGVSTCIDGDGASFCAELGFGIGASVDVDLTGAAEEAHAYVKAEAKVKAGQLGLGAEAKWSRNEAGCKGLDAKLKGQAGPLGPELKVYDHDKGWFPGKWGLKGKGSVGGAPELGDSKAETGAGAQLKAVVGKCFNSRTS